MKYTTEIASEVVTCIRIFMKICSGIREVLSLLSNQFKKLYYWFCLREGRLKYAVDMRSDGVICM
jgi:hypothetical protein